MDLRGGDATSFADSTYSSLREMASRSSTKPPVAQQQSPSLRKQPKKVPGTTDLFIFPGKIEEEVLKYYHRHRAVIEGLLIDEVTANGFDARTVSTRLEIVGKKKDTANHRLIVLCPKDAQSVVQNLLDSAHMAQCFRPHDVNMPRLEPYIIPIEPRLTSACMNIDVCSGNSCGEHSITYCGAPIMLRSGAENSSQHRYRLATFGGIIEVEEWDGKSKFYGMGAGHVIQDLHSPAKDLESTNASELDEWICKHNVLGKVLNPNRLPAVAAARARPTNDWALFSIKAHRPNAVVPVNMHLRDAKQYQIAQHIIAAKRPNFEDEASDPVLLLGSTLGTRRGELSSHPARIWISQSDTFVDAYMLELEEGNEVLAGDSGAWVVHHAGPDLYGHVVAVDAFGDAYVIPAVNTLDNIRDCLGAIAVRLPHPDVFRESGSKEEPSGGAPPFRAADYCAIVGASQCIASEADRCASTDTRIDQSTDDSKLPPHPRKAWVDQFSQDRSFDGEKFIETRRGMVEYSDPLELFLSWDSQLLSPTVAIIADFCYGFTDETLARNIHHSPHRRGAWLDDRSLTHHARYRHYDCPLTAQQLLKALQKPRFGLEREADADRRLIYIPEIDPSYIRVLAETAPASLAVVDTLRDMLWRHLSSTPSLAVNFTISGNPMFVLNFQMPFYSIGVRDNDYVPPFSDLNKSNRGRLDVSFLESGRPLTLRGMQFSLSIIGSCDSQWTAYAFEDCVPSDELEEENFCYNTVNMDPIAGIFDLDSPGYLKLVDANRPIWNPREYYLLVVRRRLSRMVKEWYSFTLSIEQALKQQECRHQPSPPSNEDQSKIKQGSVDTWTWYSRTSDLLGRTRLTLEHTLHAWKKFSSADGDLSRLLYSPPADTDSRAIHIHIDLIKRYFEELSYLEERMKHLQTYCKKKQQSALQTGLLLEELHSAVRSADNLRSFQLELMIFIISPTAIVSSFFAIPPPFGSFPRNGKTFVVAILVVTAILQAMVMLKQRSVWERRISGWVRKAKEGLGHIAKGKTRCRKRPRSTETAGDLEKSTPVVSPY